MFGHMLSGVFGNYDFDVERVTHDYPFHSIAYREVALPAEGATDRMVPTADMLSRSIRAPQLRIASAPTHGLNEIE